MWEWILLLFIFFYLGWNIRDESLLRVWEISESDYLYMFILRIDIKSFYIDVILILGNEIKWSDFLVKICISIIFKEGGG